MMNLKDFVRLHKKESVIAGIIMAIFFVFYFILFFSVGMRYDETFFTKSIAGGTTFYTGLTDRGKTDISVSAPKSGVTTVTYQQNGDLKKTYFFTLGAEKYNFYLDYSVRITNENGRELFDGNLRRGHLFDKNDEHIFDDSNGTKYFDNGDTLTASEITYMALHQYDAIRGNPALLTLALLLFLITILHSMFPLAIFSMRHMIGVGDPQPSDWYLTVQKAMWSIIPVVGLALLINAILV